MRFKDIHPCTSLTITSRGGFALTRQPSGRSRSGTSSESVEMNGPHRLPWRSPAVAFETNGSESPVQTSRGVADEPLGRVERPIVAEREGIRTPDTVARVPHQMRCLKPLSHLSPQAG
jgi:hypothetical protein